MGLVQLPTGELIGHALGEHEGKLLRSHDALTWSEIPGVSIPGNRWLGILRSGRWLATEANWIGEELHPNTQVVATRGGYPQMKESGIRYNSEMFISYSDDQGKTWQKEATMQ